MANDLAQNRPQWSRQGTHMSRMRPQRVPDEEAPDEFLLVEMQVPLDETSGDVPDPAAAENVVPLGEFEEEKEHATSAMSDIDGFICKPLGGYWTAEHVGESWDRYAVTPRANPPTRWCKLYHWPEFKSWRKTTYGGPENVRMLAQGWAKKANFFFRLWLSDHCHPDFEYNQAVVSMWEEPAEWIDWALTPKSPHWVSPRAPKR